MVAGPARWAPDRPDLLLRSVRELVVWIHENPGKALVAWGVSIFAFRLIFALGHDGFLGVDGGAYLVGRNAVLGDEPTNASFSRPPLAPGWLLVPSTALLGDQLGYNLFAAVFGMALLPAFYLLARQVLGPGWGALAAAGFAMDWPLAEMFVTGVVPIVGFAFLTITLWGLIGSSAPQLSRRHAAAVVITIPMIAFTNQTSAGLAAVMLPVAVAMLPQKRRHVALLSAGAVLALTALPWYWSVLPGADRVSYPGPLLLLNPWWASQWVQAAAGWLVGLLVLRSPGSKPVRMLAAVLLVHASLNVLLSFDESLINIFYRSSYVMQIPLWICAGWLVRRHIAAVATDVRWWAAAGLVLVGLFGMVFQYENQADHSDFAHPGVLGAIEEIPGDAGVVATNSESIGFYIAALTKKPIAWTQNLVPPASYVDRERAVRCVLGWISSCSVDGITHFLIDTQWPKPWHAPVAQAPNPADPWCCVLEDAPWLEPMYVAGTVTLYEVRR